jgi:curved DNA-binding protein CbpA
MLKKIEDMNYYELLEVGPRATAQEIHKAYERVRRIYDPNSIALYSLFSSEETEKIRQRIEAAYRTLIYDENRREYDLSLRGPDTPVRAPQAYRPVTPPPIAPQRAELPRQQPEERRPEPPPVAAAQKALSPVPADVTEFTGSVLKMLREQRGLTLQNVADTTKLSARHLEHIEDENFPKLPARPYLRGFLVIYAKALGYEPDRIVNDFMKRYDAASNLPKKLPPVK